MDLLPEELKLISPAKKIVPHCILLKQDYTVFVTGLGRLDYVEVTVSLCSTETGLLPVVFYKVFH